jgi:hypothetical protein
MNNIILLEFMNKINIELLGRDHTEPVPISGYTDKQIFFIVNLSLTKVIYVYDDAIFYLVDLTTKECMKTKFIKNNIEIIDIFYNSYEQLPIIHKFVPFLDIEYNSFPIEIKKWFEDEISLQQVLDSNPSNTRNFNKEI